MYFTKKTGLNLEIKNKIIKNLDVRAQKRTEKSGRLELSTTL